MEPLKQPYCSEHPALVPAVGMKREKGWLRGGRKIIRGQERIDERSVLGKKFQEAEVGMDPGRNIEAERARSEAASGSTLACRVQMRVMDTTWPSLEN